jgi:hypothetical protein
VAGPEAWCFNQHVYLFQLPTKMFFMWRAFTLFLSLISTTLLVAQTGCPGCSLALPDSLPADTLFLSMAPDGRVGVYYEEDLSFRLPMTTTPVNAQDPTTPAGLSIDEITILGLSGLPPGLAWEPNQLTFPTQEETDGCVRLCGQPQVAGLYEVEVVLSARIAIFTQQTTFSFPLLVEPALTRTDGFTIVNSSGCGSVTAEFINNIPSEGNPGFSYTWFFGNGNSSMAEVPAPQTFSEPGTYPVAYQAIIDTVGYILRGVEVLESPCTDLFSAPDMKFVLMRPNGEHVFTAPIIGNTDAPISWSNLFLELDTGTYRMEIVDDDGGLDGADDLCGFITFERDSLGGIYTDGDLEVALNIIHPVDTVRYNETIEVYPFPETPILSIAGEPPYCEGTELSLVVADYTERLDWYQDSMLLVEVSGNTLATTTAGDYWVTYTSAEGCSSTSAPLSVAFTPLPAPFVLQQNDNLLRIEDDSNLPVDLDFTWYYEGQPITEAMELLLCVEAAGVYTLEITDLATGCSTLAEIEATYDPTISCSTSTDEVGQEDTGWQLYPNPLQNYLWVSGPVTTNARLRLFDSLGRPVLETSLAEAGRGLPVFHLPAGAYFYQVVDASGQPLQIGKLLKQ